MFTVKKLCICLLIATGSVSHAADSPPLSEFEKWQKQRSAQFNQFVTQQDQDFSQFLQQRWLVKQVESVPKRDIKPKIKQLPTAPKEHLKPDTSEPVKVIKPEPVKPKYKTQPKLLDKPIRTGGPVEPELPKIPTFHFEFLGNKVGFVKAKLPELNLIRLNAEAIASSWQTMAESKSKKLLQQLNAVGDYLNLDDWGKAYLTHQVISRSSTKLTANEVNLYTWYYLLQQGFDSRVGYEASHVHLLLKVTQPLYGQKFFRFGDDKYYFVDFSRGNNELGSKIKTYQNQHELASAELMIDLSQVPRVAGELDYRELAFSYAGQQHKISVPYHRDYVELLNLYPQMELENYFQTGMEEESKQVLLEYLATAIEGKTEKQALNLLLRFVQKAFAYQTDDQQFNKENFLVATETLHYPYADCEDRAVLFSYLVKHLLGNKIIGVLYKGHIATAIKTNSDIDGAWYNVNGEKYLVADPTYIGASIGRVMPGYEKQSPKLVVIN